MIPIGNKDIGRLSNELRHELDPRDHKAPDSKPITHPANGGRVPSPRRDAEQ